MLEKALISASACGGGIIVGVAGIAIFEGNEVATAADAGIAIFEGNEVAITADEPETLILLSSLPGEFV
ncbi:MAG: hypothetical protein ACPG7F_12235 [Aggregatilineales bacterium]